MKRARRPYLDSERNPHTGHVFTEKFDRPPRKEKCGICRRKAYLTNYLCEGCRIKQDNHGH